MKILLSLAVLLTLTACAATSPPQDSQAYSGSRPILCSRGTSAAQRCIYPSANGTVDQDGFPTYGGLAPGAMNSREQAWQPPPIDYQTSE